MIMTGKIAVPADCVLKADSGIELMPFGRSGHVPVFDVHSFIQTVWFYSNKRSVNPVDPGGEEADFSGKSQSSFERFFHQAAAAEGAGALRDTVPGHVHAM